MLPETLDRLSKTEFRLMVSAVGSWPVSPDSSKSKTRRAAAIFSAIDLKHPARALSAESSELLAISQFGSMRQQADKKLDVEHLDAY